VHRDLKPKNVMIHKTKPGSKNGLEHIKVLDFGVARVLDRKQAFEQEWTLVGTAKYMAPEQSQGLAVSPASDIYSVGVILYHMLSGTLPFAETNDPVSTMISHATQPITPLREQCPELNLPMALESLIANMLVKTPEARPQDAMNLARELLDLREQCAPSRGEIEVTRFEYHPSGQLEYKPSSRKTTKGSNFPGVPDHPMYKASPGTEPTETQESLSLNRLPPMVPTPLPQMHHMSKNVPLMSATGTQWPLMATTHNPLTSDERDSQTLMPGRLPTQGVMNSLASSGTLFKQKYTSEPKQNPYKHPHARLPGTQRTHLDMELPAMKFPHSKSENLDTVPIPGESMKAHLKSVQNGSRPPDADRSRTSSGPRAIWPSAHEVQPHPKDRPSKPFSAMRPSIPHPSSVVHEDENVDDLSMSFGSSLRNRTKQMLRQSGVLRWGKRGSKQPLIWLLVAGWVLFCMSVGIVLLLFPRTHSSAQNPSEVSKQASFHDTLHLGDAALAEQRFDDALLHYQNAHLIFPRHPHAAQRLQKVRKEMRAQTLFSAAQRALRRNKWWKTYQLLQSIPPPTHAFREGQRLRQSLLPPLRLALEKKLQLEAKNKQWKAALVHCLALRRVWPSEEFPLCKQVRKQFK
ncbi:MAG: serine/threonine-protein kinase, partial [Myxococcota bacterium]